MYILKLCSTKESRKNILLRWLTFDNLTLKFCSQPEPGHQAWKCWTFTIKWRGPAVKRRRIRVNILGLWRFSFCISNKRYHPNLYCIWIQIWTRSPGIKMLDFHNKMKETRCKKKEGRSKYLRTVEFHPFIINKTYLR